jgi:hypothetical protein
VSESRQPRGTGRVRAARITDLAVLGELSRLCQTDDSDACSLGLPVSGPPIGVFSLFRLPLAAFRPHDILYVYEASGRVSGLVRVERENWRDDWAIVELDALPGSGAGDVRFRLVQQALREGQKRGAARFHVACTDRHGNVELFMQAGFARYGEEIVLYRQPSEPLPEPWTDARALEAGIRPARPTDAVALMSLYHAVTPMPVQRIEGFRIPDWERQGNQWRVPRSSLAPILRFADIEGYVLESPTEPALDGLVQLGVAREDQPHYLRVLARPGADAAALVEYGLGVIAARVGRGGNGSDRRGVIAPVRTYESPLDRRLEEAAFEAVATVTLLVRETLIRVAEPVLVPAGVR